MKKLRFYYSFICGLPKSFYINFKYFPFHIAIKLPIIVSHNVFIKKAKGSINLPRKIKTGMIRFGLEDAFISDLKERSLWNIEGKIIFKGNAHIGAGSKIAVGVNGILTLGENFHITSHSTISCYKEISFGFDCLLSWEILVMDTDSHPIFNFNNEIINENRSVVIGNKVWIGCKVTLLKGALIPSGCIVGANSLINKQFNTESSLIAGNPAQEKKQFVYW